jgi:hypothetical protein
LFEGVDALQDLLLLPYFALGLYGPQADGQDARGHRRCLLIYLARKNAIGQCSKALLHRLKLPARLAPRGL